MTIHFLQPQFTYRVKTPAQEFLDKPAQLILGVTYPKYEDQVIDSDNVNARVPLLISQPGAPTAQVQVTRMGQVSHRFSWEISLPPDPQRTRWISAAAPWATINTRIQQVTRGPAVPAPAPTARLELVPQPSADAFLKHIKYHEMQHAVDHRWLVQKIFGPWDAWVMQTSAITNPFRAKASSFNWIVAGGARGSSNIYYVRYYRDATDEIGASYHNTPAGARPQITYSRVIVDPVFGHVAQFNISQPSLILAGPDFLNSPPHRYFDLLSVGDYARGVRETVLSQAGNDPVMPAYTMTQADIDDHERPEDNAPTFNLFD